MSDNERTLKKRKLDLKEEIKSEGYDSCDDIYSGGWEDTDCESGMYHEVEWIGYASIFHVKFAICEWFANALAYTVPTYLINHTCIMPLR